MVQGWFRGDVFMLKNDVDLRAQQAAMEETLSLKRGRDIVCCGDALESPVGFRWTCRVGWAVMLQASTLTQEPEHRKFSLWLCQKTPGWEVTAYDCQILKFLLSSWPCLSDYFIQERSSRKYPGEYDITITYFNKNIHILLGYLGYKNV